LVEFGFETAQSPFMAFQPASASADLKVVTTPPVKEG
jgi:hypothetical protein